MRDMKNASKNQLGLCKKIFIRSTAFYVFHIAEPFIPTIKINVYCIAVQIRWTSKQLSV